MKSVLSANDVTDTRHFITNKFNESGKIYQIFNI